MVHRFSTATRIIQQETKLSAPASLAEDCFRRHCRKEKLPRESWDHSATCSCGGSGSIEVHKRRAHSIVESLLTMFHCRLICFVIDQDDTSSGIKALKRSDKGSLNSIIDILHITDELPKESLRDTIVDFSTIHAGDVMISHLI